MNKTTFMAKPGQVERKWYVVDATDVPSWTPFSSCCKRASRKKQTNIHTTH